jgi:hypothetical protein
MSHANSLEALALSYAHELHRLLGDLCDLPQHGQGSCVERAWDLMDVVVWYLDPAPEDDALLTRRLAEPVDGEPSHRDKAEIRLMLEAGVSISDAAAYFRASEAAVRQLIGGQL